MNACIFEHVYDWKVTQTNLFQDLVNRMGVAELRHIVEKMVLREPAMVFDVIDSISSQSPGRLPPSPSRGGVSWCTCGQCREMTTDLERKCCGFTAPECYSLRPVSINQRCYSTAMCLL